MTGPEWAEAAGQQVIESFHIFYCRSGCFHLLCPGVVVHFTPEEWQAVLAAMNSLWNEPDARTPRGERHALFRAYRCGQGHCHLICHGITSLSFSDRSARSLRDEMTSVFQRCSGGEGPGPAPDYLM